LSLFRLGLLGSSVLFGRSLAIGILALLGRILGRFSVTDLPLLALLFGSLFLALLDVLLLGRSFLGNILRVSSFFFSLVSSALSGRLQEERERVEGRRDER
jgi:hypothetical protein